ncbi:bifunctional diguanylate cyclase/phosphodiesterase [Paenibacillus sp. NEAU-GSW1]|uniref:bifunctional diguanylate cyclase/phosphodiesterase n=1 Tax=Paenibacillus sp. NEAU-GSW1 TaxID=2682486 RepID=UPI0012E2099F|nr:bifunctional diguanylate cyclase/phosphodiesterase [Paenibacillus sp. NEAU-GSW1]MUT66067.1 EAL domain-containing protein [Paenibacillus sp. NEAU-GSW1]
MIAIAGNYNGWVIFLSFVISLMASYSALNLVYKISHTRGKAQQGWMAASAFVMGSGIWTMHFVGMMAFHVGLPVKYDIPTTLISILAAILASYVAFYLTLSKQVNRLKLAGGGIVMGAGIVAMHYTGMASMRSPGMSITYDPLLWAVSAIIAVIVSYAALFLFIRFRHSNRAGFSKWAAAGLMGLAVCGMHYSGMTAASFWCGDISVLQEKVPLDLFLLVGVSFATLCIMLVTWGAIYFDRTVLERMAYSDPLTGLGNRHAMNRYFQEELVESASLAIMFLDLDRFKLINDTLGHDVGDLLVQAAADRLRSYMSDNVQVFRLGGDEFLLAAKNMDEAEAKQLAEQLLERIRKPYMLEGNELYITCSLGISFAPEHGTNGSKLLIAADTAMYQAKRQGKNKYYIYNQELAAQSSRRMELEKDLQLALAKQQFLLYYQPKWNAETNRPTGFEALLRWKHPVHGIVPPDEFIPIAEETGLIVSMTRWVLEQACADCVSWNAREEQPLNVSVNLSMKVFDSKNLNDMVDEALARAGLAPELLELEITETIVMNNVPDVIAQLTPLQEMGITISMDDFGSGYSSLGTLDLIPFHTLKIDKLFMQQSHLPAKRAIVNTIIVLAHQLNLEVVAEGVETEQQLEFLRTSGCRVMQGYYFSKPMPKEQLDEWLESVHLSPLQRKLPG